MFYNAIETRVAPTLNQAPVAVVKNFVGLWINDSDCFIGIHDRKISVLGLCRLITQVPDAAGAAAWQEYVPQIMPSLIMLFRGLKTAYEVRKEAEGEDEDSSDEEEGDDSDLEDVEALDTDEDDIDEDSAMYLESLQEKITKQTNGAVTVSPAAATFLPFTYFMKSSLKKKRITTKVRSK